MSELVVILLILLLAVVLIAGGLFLSRRSARSSLPGEPPTTTALKDREAPPPPVAEPVVEAPVPLVEVEVVPEREVAPVKERPRLRDRLGKTRAAFSGALARRGKIDPETWD